MIPTSVSNIGCSKFGDLSLSFNSTLDASVPKNEGDYRGGYGSENRLNWSDYDEQPPVYRPIVSLGKGAVSGHGDAASRLR